MDGAVRTLTSLALSPSTDRYYQSGVHHYLAFCTRYGQTGFPLAEQVLCSFVAFLVQEGLSYGCIRQYLCSLRHHQLIAGGPDPALASPQLCTPRVPSLTTSVSSPKAATCHASNTAPPPQVLVLGYPKLRQHMSVGSLLRRFLWVYEVGRVHMQIMGSLHPSHAIP